MGQLYTYTGTKEAQANAEIIDQYASRKSYTKYGQG